MTDKVLELAEVVDRYVQPGMVIHTGNGWANSVATLYQIVRRFNDTKPGFTFISAAANSFLLAPMLSAGLVKKVITTFWGDGYPYPGPNRVIQEAFASGEVELEEWTMLTFVLGLMAGAMNIPFFPTKSILGSDIAGVNTAFKAIKNPFYQAEEVGLVKALKPDLSLTHGWMADADGNTVITPPFAGGVWGALASRQGVIVTVEKIVSKQYLHNYRHLVKIPGSKVLAVSEVPLGAHPGGHHHGGTNRETGNGYIEDHDFALELRAACRKQETLRQWMEEWIFGVPDHASFLQKLGPNRLAKLKGNLFIDTDRYVPKLKKRLCPGKINRDSEQTRATPAETMIVLAKRELVRIVRQGGYRHLLAGIGASHLAAWLCYEELLLQGVSIHLLSEIGLFGYFPCADDPYLFGVRNVPSAIQHTDIINILGVYGANALGVLGAAEVDKMGNLNTSRAQKGPQYLIGSGGSNDIANGVEEVVVVAYQNQERYLEKVSFVTSPGARITTLVSQMGVFRKRTPDTPLVLMGIYSEQEDLSKELAIERVREACGWSLEVDPGVVSLKPPTVHELAHLRRFDPSGFFLGRK